MGEPARWVDRPVVRLMYSLVSVPHYVSVGPLVAELRGNRTDQARAASQSGTKEGMQKHNGIGSRRQLQTEATEMDWAFWSRGIDPPFSGLFDPPNSTHDPDDCTSQAGHEGRKQPSDLEFRLIQLAYECVADQSCCGRCGATLSPNIRAARLSPGNSKGHIKVATNCSAWRRHRHIAHVVDESQDLRLGPFLLA